MYSGHSAISTHISRCVYRPHRKIRLRCPVRSMSRLDGSDTSDARKGNAASSPNWNLLAPRCLASSVSGAPLVAVSHTAPNTHPRVTISRDRRSDQNPGRVHGLPIARADENDSSGTAWSSSEDEVDLIPTPNAAGA